MRLNYLHLLLLAHYAAAHDQKTLDPREEEAIAECKRLEEQNGGIYLPAPDGDGDWNCVVCVGTPYVHPKTGIRRCCMLDTVWTVDPVHVLEGRCCPAGKKFSFDPVAGKGDCCEAGQSFVEVACKGTAPPSPPTTSSPSTRPSHPSTSTPTIPPIIPECLAHSNTDPGCSCPKADNKCPPAGTLGIRYGQCYTVTDVEGRQLTRTWSGTPWYYHGTRELKNLVFRICHSLTSCSELQGQYVPEGGNWFQLDLTRQPNEASPEPGWVGSQGDFLGLVPINSQANRIANFVANSTCLFEKCPLCIRLSTALLGSSGTTDTGLSSWPDNAINFFRNPVICHSVVYQEATCLDSTSSSLKA